MKTSGSDAAPSPAVWAVVVGYNHVEDSVECLRSLQKTDVPGLRTVFVDNHSGDGSAERIGREFPGVAVLRTRENLGFARGYNVGLAHALAQGADFVFMLNNDTVVNASTVRRLLESSQAHPEAGVLVPKIFYFDHPERIWSAGSKYRRFPPVVVLRKTKGPDDGRYDADPVLEFATTCALLFPRRFLEQLGLLDPNYFIFYDDYDLSLRARDGGFTIRLVPDAHLWHKVSKSTEAGSRNPFFWHNYGRSEMIFCRRQRHHRWLTSWVHRLYVMVRLVAEGKHFGLAPFIKGMRVGRDCELKPIPRWNDGAVESAEILSRGTP